MPNLEGVSPTPPKTKRMYGPRIGRDISRLAPPTPVLSNLAASEHTLETGIVPVGSADAAVKPMGRPRGDGGITALVRREDIPWDGSLEDRVAEEYYRARGSLSSVARIMRLPYRALKAIRQNDRELQTKLACVDEILSDEVHQQYMDHSLNPDERNPAWKIFFLKAHDPRYAEKVKQVKVDVQISDSTFKRKVIDVTPVREALTG